jgi:hypothetical protein
VQPVAEDHFSTGVFAHPLPGELFNAYSCVACGNRSTTWAGFREHRAGCTGTPADHLGHTAAAGAVAARALVRAAAAAAAAAEQQEA